MLFLTSIFLALITTSLAVDIHENSTDVTELFTSETKLNSTEIVPLNGTDSKLNISMLRITQPSTMSKTVTVQNGIKETKHDHFSNERFVPSPQLESYIEYNNFAIRPGVPDAKNVYSKNTYLPPYPPNVISVHVGKTLPPTGHEERTILTAPNVKQDLPNENYYPDNFYLPVGHSITFTTSAPPFSSTSELPIPSAQDKQLIFPQTIEKPLRFEGDFPSLKFYERYNYGPSAFPNTMYQNLPNFEWYNKMMFPTKQAPVPVAEHPYPFVFSDLTKTSGVSAVSGQKSAIELPLETPMHSKMAPWKRAAKIFAAILPIGLLISALTPNILTITSTNDTTAALCRKLAGRAEGLGVDRASIEKWSKSGCEARLLCETAIREDSLDVDRVKKLFWNFVKMQKMKELQLTLNPFQTPFVRRNARKSHVERSPPKQKTEDE